MPAGHRLGAIDVLGGVTVTVTTPSSPSSKDRFGNDVPGKPTTETVANVLVDPGETADLGADRPNGDAISLVLHFPKTYTASLRGCTVELPAPWAGSYRVVGDPKPYMDENTPTPWNRPVKVEVAHG